METGQISHFLIVEMQSIVGQQYVLVDEESLFQYSHDETEDLSFLPDVALKPANAREVSQIMQFCNQNIIPVTARGAGTGLSGSALPVNKGILL